MITFIVPARSGSQRLKNKNIRLLDGKPLIFHTIDSLLNQKQISRVIFTSDSEKYCNLVTKEYGDQVTVLLRPFDTAQNKSKVVDEVERLLINMPELFSTQWFGLALPTAPLRNHSTVSRALDYFSNIKKPIFSCNEYDFPVQFAFRFNNENKSWSPLIENSPMITGNTRSQDIEKLYRPNGALYINEKSNFLESKILYQNADAFEISRVESLDIDTELDFKIVETIINYKK